MNILIKIYDFFKRIFKILRVIEKYTVVFFLSLMIVLSFLMIILRNFGISVSTLEKIVKYSVLWICMLGAGLAVFENNHIKIDLVGRLVKGRKKSIVLFVTNFVSASLSVVFAIISFSYIFKTEYSLYKDNPDNYTTFLHIPNWILLLIIPIGFIILSIRFSLQSGQKVINFINNIEEKEDLQDILPDLTE